MDHTDEQGFTDLTAGKGRDGLFTGRVKGLGEEGETVVETGAQRSERDAQGRELDSYGKPYSL